VPTEPIAAARATVDGLILDLRGSGDAGEPALLIRAGQLATRVDAAEALAARGDGAAAALAASAALRLIARDFPARQLPALDLLAEESAYRRIGLEEISA